MRIAEQILRQWEHEASQTRRILERVSGDLDWKPHEKSMTLGALAQHVANIPHWATVISTQDSYEWTGERVPPATAPEEIMQQFEMNDSAMRAALAELSDERMLEHWRFGPEDKPIFVVPRVAAFRGFVLSHLIHHRGQLTVYLRLLDIPVPGMYGPSADEMPPK